jgi:RNA polymerase sigma factor (sigma-70 family)
MATFVELESGIGLDVAALYAAQAGRVRHSVRASVRAPDPVIEDACQFAWSRLVLHRGRVRPETASAWLVTTAIHEAFKLLRREAREVSLEGLLERAGEAGWLGPTPAVTSLEEVVQRRARLESIGSLPERQQRLVWLQGLGFSYDEMAGETGDTPRTVERQLQRARRSLARAAA